MPLHMMHRDATERHKSYSPTAGVFGTDHSKNLTLVFTFVQMEKKYRNLHLSQYDASCMLFDPT